MFRWGAVIEVLRDVQGEIVYVDHAVLAGVVRGILRKNLAK